MRSGLVFWPGGRQGVVAGTFLLVVVVVLLELLAVSVALRVHPGLGLRKEDLRLEYGPVFRSGLLRCVEAGDFLRAAYSLELVAGCFHRCWDVEKVLASLSGEVHRLSVGLRKDLGLGPVPVFVDSGYPLCVDAEAVLHVMCFLELVADFFRRRWDVDEVWVSPPGEAHLLDACCLGT